MKYDAGHVNSTFPLEMSNLALFAVGHFLIETRDMLVLFRFLKLSLDLYSAPSEVGFFYDGLLDSLLLVYGQLSVCCRQTNQTTVCKAGLEMPACKRECRWNISFHTHELSRKSVCL